MRSRQVCHTAKPGHGKRALCSRDFGIVEADLGVAKLVTKVVAKEFAKPTPAFPAWR
jgi:hypothetical protein